MAKALEAAVPGATVQITVRGGRGFSAAEMLNLIRQSLTDGSYQLVIWQTGTIEAVRNTPPGEFAETLVAGAEAVQAANADLVLIDPQFSRFLQTNSNLEPYEDAFQQVAAMQGVLLFRRFDLMRNWANDGQIDLERTPRPDRTRTVEQLHTCLGEHLGAHDLRGRPFLSAAWLSLIRYGSDSNLGELPTRPMLFSRMGSGCERQDSMRRGTPVASTYGSRPR